MHLLSALKATAGWRRRREESPRLRQSLKPEACLVPSGEVALCCCGPLHEPRGLTESGAGVCPCPGGARTGYTGEKDFRPRDLVNE